MPVTRPSLRLSRILSFRYLSPLLILSDTILQSAYPLLTHFEECARAEKLKVIRIGYSQRSDVCTITRPSPKTPSTYKPIDGLISEIESLIRSASTSEKHKILLSIPDLNDFLANNPAHLTTFLSALIALSPARISVCAIHHTDLPLLQYPSHLPSPSTLLGYLATTIITVQSLTHVVAKRTAALKSQISHVDLDLEGKDILSPLGSNHPTLVLTVESRRKSGRAVFEECVYDSQAQKILVTVPELSIALPSDKQKMEEKKAEDAYMGEDEIGFKIGLTDKQKANRDNYELPHFQAQREAEKVMNIYYEPDSGDDIDLEDPDDDLML